MKYLSLLVLGLGMCLINVSASAATSLKTCSWIGEDSTPYFAHCINSNFKRIKTVTGLELNSCMSYSKKLDFSYQNCSKKNFRHISERLRLKLDKCPILGEDVNLMYVACIQKNFKTIGRALP